MELSHTFIHSAIGTVSHFGTLPVTVSGSWNADSRTIQKGDAFIAISGKRCDGHDYIAEALEKGASLVIAHVSYADKLQELQKKISVSHSYTILYVEDTVEAVCALAAAWRAQFNYPVIGITGSVGKTTTKELIATIFGKAGKPCVTSYGNQNTRIGLAMNMLKMRAEHACAIFEMGVSKRGEMKRLSNLVKPTIGIITAIGHSHMEGIGSLVDIASEKRDIFSHLAQNGIGIVNGDQPLIGGVAYACPTIKFGLKMINRIQARQIHTHPRGIEFILRMYQQRYPVILPTENQARVLNVLAAAAAAHFLGISMDHIIDGIQQDVAVDGRFKKQFIPARRQMIIDDSYNANPESMKSALLAFERMEATGKKIAILGDMLELGVNTPFWHRQLGRFLRKVPSISHVIFVGEHVQWAKKTVPYGLTTEVVKTWEDALAYLKQRPELANQTSILVKGSRGIGLNNVVSALMDQQ